MEDDDPIEKNKPEWIPKFYRDKPRVSFTALEKNSQKDNSKKNAFDYEISAQITNTSNSKKEYISYSASSGSTVKSASLHFDKWVSDIFVLGYGANRSMGFNKLSENESEISETLFKDDAKLINAEEWLLQMDYAASRTSEIQDVAIKRRDKIIQVLKGILPDVSQITFSIPNIENLVPKVEFHTTLGIVGIRQLSYGYRTMVAWIVDVAARMFDRYPTAENPLEEAAIILVDEIDLHLHPKWQRQIFDFLETRFPKAQFIVTAHSPLIVQSAPKDANIIVLRKEKIGDEYIVKIDNDVASVRNWRIDQIMTSDLFGIESVRNPDIEKQMEERTQLLQKDTLTDIEKERLDELNKLSQSLPTAENHIDREAMEIIRKAAEELKGNRKNA